MIADSMENFATRKELTSVFCVQIYSSTPDINICCGEISCSLKYILLFIIISYTESESTFLVRETKRIKKSTTELCRIVHYLEVITSGLSNWVRNTLHWRKKLVIVEVN